MLLRPAFNRVRDRLREEERGATLVELLVSVSIGLVVLSGLTMVIVVTLHGSNRVSARVDATQQARLVVTRIVQQLHSACVAPKIAPILSGSSANTLRFIHASPGEGTAVAPLPTLSEITLSDGVLRQTDRPAVSGTSPSWTYASTTTTRELLRNVAPIPPAGGIFSYFVGSGGAIEPTPQTVPLTTTTAPFTVQVRVALQAWPSRDRSPIDDPGAPAPVRDGATLRLTPPSFNQAAESLPCQ